MTPGVLVDIFRRALAGWWNDNVPRMGAALAYYTLFALVDGIVKFEFRDKNRKKVSVYPAAESTAS